MLQKPCPIQYRTLNMTVSMLNGTGNPTGSHCNLYSSDIMWAHCSPSSTAYATAFWANWSLWMLFKNHPNRMHCNGPIGKCLKHEWWTWKFTYDLSPSYHCRTTHKVMWSHYGHLAIGLNLGSVATSHCHMIIFCEVFCNFLPKKHPLDKMGSQLRPHGLLNNHSDLLNYHG